MQPFEHPVVKELRKLRGVITRSMSYDNESVDAVDCYYDIRKTYDHLTEAIDYVCDFIQRGGNFVKK